MKATHAAALAVVVAFASAASAADPFEHLRGKIKPGLYEYKSQMDMSNVPGMPPGMTRPPVTFTHCVTEEDIAKGRMNRNPRDPESGTQCDFTNVKTSGNTTSYTMVCTGRSRMKADMVMTFTGDGWNGDMTMNMEQNGHPMTMKQHMETRYKGACP
ncbi:MAG: DUF3617 domain-containing protein [Bacillota bacterium]